MAIVKKPAPKTPQKETKQMAKVETKKPTPAQKKQEETSTAIALRTQQALAQSNIDVEEDAAEHQEHFNQSDLALPFLTALQSNSPQCKPGDGKYIEGAVMGMLLQTASGELFDGLKTGVRIVPAAYAKVYIEWRPREQGGGFVAMHDEATGLKMLSTCTKGGVTGKKDILPNGNELAATAQHFCILDKEDGSEPEGILLSLVSTQLKKSKKMNSYVQALRIPKKDGNGTFNPPPFYTAFRLKTIPESNGQGSWYGYDIQPESPVGELDNGAELYIAAKNFREAVRSGAVKAGAPDSAEESGSSEEAPF